MLQDRMASTDVNSEISSAFNLFDTKNKGYIDFADLKRVAKELGETDLDDKDFWASCCIPPTNICCCIVGNDSRQRFDQKRKGDRGRLQADYAKNKDVLGTYS